MKIVAGLAVGKVVVVTGAASGLGRAICLRFAEEGAAAIIVADVLEAPREGGAPTTVLVEKLGTRSVFVRTDVSSEAQMASAIAAAEPFGGVDVMVNNAGVVFRKSFVDITEADYERLMAINVKGTFFGAQSAARAMLASGKPGSIINISSVAGIRGSSMLSAYCASKGAVRLLTYALAAELGPKGIRVNAIHPGIHATEMVIKDLGGGSGQPSPLRRMGTAGDVAENAVYLASSLASYVNGASIVVDGGLSSTFG